MIEWIEWMNERKNIILYYILSLVHSFNSFIHLIINNNKGWWGYSLTSQPSFHHLFSSSQACRMGINPQILLCLAQAVWQCKFCCRFWISLPYMSRLSHLTTPCSFARLKLQLFLWLLLAAISDFQSDSIFNMFISTVLFFKVNWAEIFKPRPGVEAQQIF